MKFWLSGEVMADVGENFREATNEIEDDLNANFDGYDYGPALKQLSFIAIIRPGGDDAYPEIYKYSKKRQTVEARLKVNHPDFRMAATKEGRKRLLLDAIERAIARISELKIDADHQRLLSDFQKMRES